MSNVIKLVEFLMLVEIFHMFYDCESLRYAQGSQWKRLGRSVGARAWDSLSFKSSVSFNYDYASTVLELAVYSTPSVP